MGVRGGAAVTPPPVPGMEVALRRVGPEAGCPAVDVARIGANDWSLLVAEPAGPAAGSDAAQVELVRRAARAACAHQPMPSDALGEVDEALLGQAAGAGGACSAVLARVQLDACGTWLTLATAGGLRPIVVRRAGWIDVRGHPAPALGGAAPSAFADDRVGLGPGDALVAVTGNLTGAPLEGGRFADEALLDALLDGVGMPVGPLVELVVDRALATGDLAGPAAVLAVKVPDQLGDDPLRRIERATGLPRERLHLPGHPLGDVQPDLWRRPPRPPREARVRLAGPADLRELRQLLARLLRSWRLDDLADGTVELLATEVATNALRHGRPPVVGIVRYLGDVVRVEVGDGSQEQPAVRAAAEVDEGGRGLELVEALATRWGTLPTRTGKRVWFDVAA